MTTSETPRDITLGVALGRQIAAERHGRSWSLEHLAERTGIHKNTIWKYENAKTQIPLGAISDISDAFGIEPHRLMRAAEERRADLRAQAGAEQAGLAQQKTPPP